MGLCHFVFSIQFFTSYVAIITIQIKDALLENYLIFFYGICCRKFAWSYDFTQKNTIASFRLLRD
jgi:hypothetical protein